MPPALKNKESFWKITFIALVGAASVSKFNFPPGSTWYIVCDAIVGAGAILGIASNGFPPSKS